MHAYDPVANTWTTCAPLSVARTGASCVAVDGKIVVAGGWSGAGHLRSAETYDPATDSWSNIASMEHTRAWAMAECVDGKVVVAGGVSVREAEQDENMPIEVEEEEVEEEEEEEEEERAEAITVVEQEQEAEQGQVEQEDEDEVEDEEDEEDEPTTPAVSASISVVNTSVEIYDPTTNRWTAGVDLVRATSQAASFVSNEGALVTLGGKVDGNPSRAASQFDRATNAWTDMAELPVSVAGATAIKLGPNRWGVVGGTGEATDCGQMITMKNGEVSWSPAPWGRTVGSGENTTCAAIWA